MMWRNTCTMVVVSAMVLMTGISVVWGAGPVTGPLKSHPDNSRWFVTPDGKAVFLTGSHTWANFQDIGIAGETPPFDYEAYLDFMEAHGHNFMRLWTWEHASWLEFAPPEKMVAFAPLPYPRTGPGRALDGGLKFDCSRWNQKYFDRLRDRVKRAREHGIYVSVMLFQGWSVEQKTLNGADPTRGNPWNGHPFNRANNINGVDGDFNNDGMGAECHTLLVQRVTRLQEAYVRKVIDTLADLDNVLYEISNESNGGSTDWQYAMIRYIKAQEKGRMFQHPVGMTFQYGHGKKRGSSTYLFESPADWVSPDGKLYLEDPREDNRGKVVIVDTDHIQPFDQDPSWVWKNLCRGNSFIAMDSYDDVFFKEPKIDDPAWEIYRAGMGYARGIADTVNLPDMRPSSELSRTGYCLYGGGNAVVVFSPDAEPFGIAVDDEDDYAGWWLDIVTGKKRPIDTMSITGATEFVPPFTHGTVLFLQAVER